MDTTERLHVQFSLSRIGEGNGNPLQCSCLENPRDGGAWWAVVYGVAQSQTQLKRLSSRSSRELKTNQNLLIRYKFSSVQFSRSVMSDSLQPHGLQHARPPCPSPTPGTVNSCIQCHAKSLQSCPTPCDPIDGSPPGSLGFSRQEHWSGLPLPSPMHESEK